MNVYGKGGRFSRRNVSLGGGRWVFGEEGGGIRKWRRKGRFTDDSLSLSLSPISLIHSPLLFATHTLFPIVLN
jgi:hypothetical protein